LCYETAHPVVFILYTGFIDGVMLCKIGKRIGHGGGDGGDDDGDDDDYFDDFDDGEEEGRLFSRRIVVQEVKYHFFGFK
jgi:hypothetical protein